ncbi:MAG: hypothetical protein A3K19_29670 [Lentisphaerae bacterium RIFOXYB12_FULL_65_16]|nr:MAG: hypothetical protein A3K18_33280 [Lentisphaerae bacterium RIFOXYA12_64_32]OGV86497.1 MAG: hypothetical protein A3K19_29670 [Lentisphaerae bacterium RIFOXYB12_FULL_65_16]
MTMQTSIFSSPPMSYLSGCAESECGAGTGVLQGDVDADDGEGGTGYCVVYRTPSRRGGTAPWLGPVRTFRGAVGLAYCLTQLLPDAAVGVVRGNRPLAAALVLALDGPATSTRPPRPRVLASRPRRNHPGIAVPAAKEVEHQQTR